MIYNCRCPDCKFKWQSEMPQVDLCPRCYSDAVFVLAEPSFSVRSFAVYSLAVLGFTIILIGFVPGLALILLTRRIDEPLTMRLYFRCVSIFMKLYTGEVFNTKMVDDVRAEVDFYDEGDSNGD